MLSLNRGRYFSILSDQSRIQVKHSWNVYYAIVLRFDSNKVNYFHCITSGIENNRNRCCTALTFGLPGTTGKHSVKRITTVDIKIKLPRYNIRTYVLNEFLPAHSSFTTKYFRKTLIEVGSLHLHAFFTPF